MKKEIWDWLHPKLCRNSGKSNVKNTLQAGRHSRSSAAVFENTKDARRASRFSPFGGWSDSGRMSGVDVDADVDETEAVSGGMDTEPLVIGVLGGINDINGVEENLADGPNFDIQEDQVEMKKLDDLPNQIIQSLQPSDHGRIKEIFCRFNFLADYLISRSNPRQVAFNAFDGREKNVESELELMTGDRSSVRRLKKILGWKIDESTSLHFEQPKLDKVKRVFLKKLRHKIETKKSDGCLVHTSSKKVLLASEALEITTTRHCKVGSTSEQERRNFVHSSFSAERNGDLISVSAPTANEEVADYRIITDSNYIVLEW